MTARAISTRSILQAAPSTGSPRQQEAGGSPLCPPTARPLPTLGYTKTDTNHVMELWTMSADGGNATLQSQGFDREPRGIKWAPDGGALYFTAEDRGSIHLYSWSRGKGIRQLTNGPEVRASPTIGKGAIAAVRSSFREPGNVVLLNERKPESVQQLTHLNDELLREVLSPMPRRFGMTPAAARKFKAVSSSRRFSIRARHYPLLLEIHGGPQGHVQRGFQSAIPELRGETVTSCSSPIRADRPGYGTAFGDAILQTLPWPDYDDLMAGVGCRAQEGHR